ncbi:unnamed protein product [Caenorhabditis angaria]|uniref:Serine/threonine-protein kinase dkf-1 n=1 Tax=Caenorhabditis angaria TaxID=860376 RepID=A0A9P1I7V1_9PELO|nr:unnamed protein product [Caenorhabditis angaria]
MESDQPPNFGESEANPHVVLRYGGCRETVGLMRNEQMLDVLLQLARQIVEKLENSLENRQMYLFRHDYNSPTLLHPLTSPSQINNGCIIEIITVERAEPAPAPHLVEPETYMRPTFCDFCGEMLTGFIRQGVKCKNCGGNFHKRCSNAARNNCSSAPSASGSSAEPFQSRPQNLNFAAQNSPQTTTTTTQFPIAALSTPSGLPHTLIEHSYRQFTVCKVCDHLLVGLVKQGLKCRDCGVNVHRKCAIELASNCVLSENAIARVNFNDTPVDASGSLDNIPLFRLPGQVGGTRGTEKKNLEGWMMHFLLSDPERRLKHYWMLMNNAIHMYNEYTEGIGVNPNRVYRQIPLAEIVSVVQNNGKSVLAKHPPHCFEIRTTNNTVFCIGEDYHAFSGGPPKKIPRSMSVRPTSNTTMWFQFIKESLQPPSRTEDNTEQALEFANLYQVLSDKTLGSGQFGTVYSAIQRHSGKEVAVKVISKERFSKKSSSAESMRAEVAILQQTCHPGIVRLEFMCETKDKIFVVMEKMNGDMLEMILSQELGRLNSRATKFLLVQILCALKYLHDQGIAHCDLKPENVLLSDMGSNFPQTKICDFGYARFIPESQFRKTVVGTPAYLPPEVLQRKGYNKSLDMWSVGVIIYVTLSGTFPFNEGEEVAEQIQNASFMFPSDPWSEVEPLAVDLIQQLLRVEIEARISIEKCLDHEWLKGEQLYRDLRDLEIRLCGPRYLTSEQDDHIYGNHV